MRPALSFFGVLALLSACGADRDTGPDPVRLDPNPHGDVDVVPPLPVGGGIRPRRRMDLDQIRASFVRATGGPGWTGWDTFSATLGKPDYAVQTHEDLTPSLLFHKFLDDASRSVCDEMVAREPGLPAEERVLLHHVEPTDTLVTAPSAVRENLAELVLRFHGTRLATRESRIEPWVRLFDDVTTETGNPVAGWRAVCVALLEHPDFYSY